MSKKWTVQRNRNIKADGQEILNCESRQSGNVKVGGPKKFKKVRIAASPLLRPHPKCTLTLRTLTLTLTAP